MTEDRLYEELKKIGIELSERQKEQFQMYYELLVEWNNKMNLTAITKKEEVYLKHFYDSATLVKVIDFNNVGNLCDIGTGAGFPGIVIKILFPHLKITLVDALNKRLLFLNEVIQILRLHNVDIVHARAEEYAIDHRDEFDVVTSRAVAPLTTLLEYSVPIVKINGYFIPMKGDIAQEIKESGNAIKIMNVKLICQEEFQLPVNLNHRTILKFQKFKVTSVKYPRKYSDMKKKPL